MPEPKCKLWVYVDVHAMSQTTTYPISQQFRIEFSPYEDRLILSASRGSQGPVRVLLTRRMVMVILQQLLKQLPRVTGLNQTPAAYWQEVLGMAHQHAMESKKRSVKAVAKRRAAVAAPAPPPDPTAEVPPIYLATELTLQARRDHLVLAFKGLPLPTAMTVPSAHEPVLAAPLQNDHVHQLLHLLIEKAQAAQWHLPVDLPWMETPQSDTSGPGLSSKSH
jgi:hypothetical protein